jgi:predicted nucleotidyltransferase
MYLSIEQKLILDRFFKTKPVKAVYLFGSYARGEAEDQSDIDLLIDLDIEKINDAWDILGYSEDLENLLHKKVDIATKLSKYITHTVEKEKILIYAQK